MGALTFLHRRIDHCSTSLEEIKRLSEVSFNKNAFIKLSQQISSIYKSDIV